MRRSREKHAAQRTEAQGSKHPHVSLPTREDDLDNREVVGDNAGLSTTPTNSTKLKQADLCMPLSAVPKSLHLPFAAVLALALPQIAPHRKFQLTTKTGMNPTNNNERTQTSKPRQTNDAIQRRRKQDATPQSLWYALFCTPTMES